MDEPDRVRTLEHTSIGDEVSAMAFSVLERERTVASTSYNRWLIPPAALAIHLCIGQVYATSVYKNSLVAHFDTSLTSVGLAFSIAIVMLGLSAAVLGTWVDTGGPRRAMVASALCWSAGLLVGSLGIATSQLWLLYLGLRRHRRHRPRHRLHLAGLDADQVVPRPARPRDRSRDHGLRRRRARGVRGVQQAARDVRRQLRPDRPDVGRGRLRRVVALPHARAGLPRRHALRCLAREGAAGGLDARGLRPRARSRSKDLVTTESVTANDAVRTPQFWLLWVVLFCNVTAGIGILEQAAPMIQDFFRGPDGSSVDAAAAAAFVGFLSLCNMAGRFVWSSTSDQVGRKRTYIGYLGIGMVLYVLLATGGDSATIVFVVLAGVIISFYGGGFATVPAYLRDLFGTAAGRRDPRPAPHRLVGRRCRRPAHRQRLPRRRGDAG